MTSYKDQCYGVSILLFPLLLTTTLLIKDNCPYFIVMETETLRDEMLFQMFIFVNGSQTLSTTWY